MSTSSPTPSSPKTAHNGTTQPQSLAPTPTVAPDTNSAPVPEDKAASDGTAIATPALNDKGDHLLETPWTLWYDHKMPNATTPQVYAEHLKKLGTFSTVEGFYRVYANLLRPNDLPKDSNYHLFRNEVTPMWENFPNGGCWMLKVKKKDPEVRLGLLWEQLLFATIGESFEDPKIVGIVLSIRTKADVIALWSSDGQNNSIVHRMSDRLRSILNLSNTIQIEYKPHLTSMKDKSTYRNGKVVTPKDKKRKGKKSPQAAAGAADGAKEEAPEKVNSNASGTQEKVDTVSTSGDGKASSESNTKSGTGSTNTESVVGDEKKTGSEVIA